MKNQLFIIIAILLFFQPAFSANCTTPTKEELENFFENRSNWIEVKAANSTEIETIKTVRIFINFSTPQASQATMAGKTLGSVKIICIEGNGLVIKTNRADIRVQRNNYGIQTRAFGQTLYYVENRDQI